jgi:hypothetical protein
VELSEHLRFLKLPSFLSFEIICIVMTYTVNTTQINYVIHSKIHRYFKRILYPIITKILSQNTYRLRVEC